jgi:phosphopantothenoylcysteine decarboxylase/phosphopantothenate--cysteine ligase
MWEHSATVANVATLRNRGAIVLEPGYGRLTGTDTGRGRLPEPAEIAGLAELLLHRPAALPRDLAGRRLLITAGGTRESLDPVRFLGNRSSGRQGFALASVAAARGARVSLIAANVELPAPSVAELVEVGSAEQLREATLAAAKDADVVVMAGQPGLVQDQEVRRGAGPGRAGGQPGHPLGPGRGPLRRRAGHPGDRRLRCRDRR